ncbi:hypothetical protein MLD38_035649 [Melastoma candidum]|nr:hypothetical protein MLD38_035649 [Melastoma candidum]
MRKQLTDENYIHKPSTSGSQDNGTSLQESRTPRKTAASIAAEVVDKLAASTSSQLIMTSVLSSFAAEEAKNAGFTKSAPATEKPMMLAPSPAANHSFSHGLIPPQAVPSQIPTSQPLYQILPNPPTQPYIQPAGPAVASYGFINFPASHGLPPPPQMASPLVTAPPGFQQMVPNQMLTLAQPAVPVAPKPPFRPLQPPQMMYYAHQHQPQ